MEALGKSVLVVDKSSIPCGCTTRVPVFLLTVNWGSFTDCRGYLLALAWDPLPPASKPSTLCVSNFKSLLSSSIASNLWPSSTSKDPRDYIRTNWIIQDNLILKFIALIQCAKFILPCKVTRKEKFTFSWMPSLKEKTGWDHQRKMWERNPRSALWIIPTGRGQRKEKKQKN